MSARLRSVRRWITPVMIAEIPRHWFISILPSASAAKASRSATIAA